jgi:putative multiple sugar transport system substrate-binding protein
MRKFITYAIALTVAGSIALTGCGTERAAETPPAPTTGDSDQPVPAAGFPQDAVIGVALPQKTSENWVLAEGLFNDGLKEAGFNGIVQFANGGVTEQQNQISAMVTQGAKVLIVGAIDGSQLGTQLKQARDAGAFVIAYERMLTNTSDVDFTIGFDSYKVGVLQGTALLEGLEKLKGSSPWNIELIAGSPDDSLSKKFFDGAMSVLQPKLDDGTLVVVSGQTSFEQVATQGWKAENAQKRFDTILAANYADKPLHGILSPNDTLARAALTACQAAGKTGDEWPVATGQDSEEESVKWIMDDKQYSTIYKDTRTLVAKNIEAVKELQAGKTLETNIEPVDNGTIEVPAYMIDPLIVTKENAPQVYADDPNLGPLTK